MYGKEVLPATRRPKRERKREIYQGKFGDFLLLGDPPK
jgi:hypothetical protein